MALSSVRRLVVDMSRHYFGVPVLLLSAVLLLTCCHPAVITDPNNPNFVVAQKGDWKVLRSDLNKEINDYLRQHQATLDQVGPAQKPMLDTVILKNMVLRKLLLDEASTLQLKQADVDKQVDAQIDQLKTAAGGQQGPGSDDDKLQQQLKLAGLTLDELKTRLHDKILVEKVLEAEAFKNVDPTEQEIDDIYLKNKDKLNIPEKVRASRVLILVNDKMTPAEKAAKKKEIDKARARVMHGEDFSKVATDVSEDRYSAPRGGDLNLFQRGDNPDAGFDDVAFNTKENVVSPVFLTPLGYQFLKVTAIQPAGVIPEAQARAYISSKLREVKMGEQEQAYAKKLLADSGVIYNIKIIDPPAQVASPNGPGAPDNAAPAESPDASGPATPAEAPPDTNSAAPATAPTQ
jgi:parvulin-like peptidyl-prolyl isomerase